MHPSGESTRSYWPTVLLSVVSLSGLALIGCADRPTLLAEHPIPDSLSVDLADAIVVPRSGSRSVVDGLEPFIARLRDHRVVASVGAERDATHSVTEEELQSGHGDHIFGRIMGVRFLDEETFAVLDQHASRVDLFDLDAVLRGSVGSIGEGPGEFQTAVSLLAPAGNALWVLDGAGAIHMFESGAGGDWTFAERRNTRGFPRAACHSGVRAVIHTPAFAPGDDAGGVLHTVGFEGAPGPAFARPYRYDQALVADGMQRGLVACPAGDIVVLALQGSNRVEAYDPTSGALLWHAVVDGIRIPHLRELRLPDGRTMVQQNLRGAVTFHFLSGIETAPTLPIVLQYERFRWSEDADRPVSEGFDTFVLDPFGRGGLYVGDDLPRIAALSPRHLATLWEDPHPRVEVAEW